MVHSIGYSLLTAHTIKLVAHKLENEIILHPIPPQRYGNGPGDGGVTIFNHTTITPPTQNADLSSDYSNYFETATQPISQGRTMMHI